MISGSSVESLSDYRGTSHPLDKGECLESPGVGIFRFRQDNNLDIYGRQAVLQEGNFYGGNGILQGFNIGAKCQAHSAKHISAY